jgi:hypothetical protein
MPTPFSVPFTIGKALHLANGVPAIDGQTSQHCKSKSHALQTVEARLIALPRLERLVSEGLLQSPTAANSRRLSYLSKKRPRTAFSVWRALQVNWRGALVMESTAESIVIHDNVTSGRIEQHNGARGLGFAADSLAWDETVARAILSISERCPIQTAFNEKSHHVTSTSGEPILCNGCRYVQWGG